MNNLKLLLSLLLLAFTSTVFSQRLDSENKLTIPLSDGITVTLYGKAKSLSDEKTLDYYYLPCNLRLSQKPDGTPQFLFLKYTTEEREDNGGVSGAILHLLMEYGLTQEQEEELEKILKSKHKATLKGMADVTTEENSVRVISATLSGLKEGRVVLTGKAPVMPGSKIAIAAHLDKHKAQLLAATFEKTRSITDLSLNLTFDYDVRFPAAKGYFEEDWSKIDSFKHINNSTYKHSTSNGRYKTRGHKIRRKKTYDHHYSYDEVHEIHQSLMDSSVIKLVFEENMSDERVTASRDAFFQMFMDRMTDKSETDVAPPAGKRELEEMPDIKHGSSYTFNKTFKESIEQGRYFRVDLNHSVSVKRSHQLTENLASWYDGVKDNKKCVGMVNLNDPFFKHRDIHLILDMDAQDMFAENLNFVTVAVRKKRSAKDAHDFAGQATIDAKYLEENGNRLTMTYSKAEDLKPELYEYKVQWSFRGGDVYPRDTSWTKGDWQAVSLAPPIKKIPMHFEADLEDLEKLDIKNVTLQVRYPKLGKEYEENMRISQHSKSPFADQNIYIDNNASGYAYRLIFDHKHKGKLALDWEERLNTNYVFATIPEDLRKGDKNFMDKAIQLGKKVKMHVGEKEIDQAEQIIGRFKGILK